LLSLGLVLPTFIELTLVASSDLSCERKNKKRLFKFKLLSILSVHYSVKKAKKNLFQLKKILARTFLKCLAPSGRSDGSSGQASLQVMGSSPVNSSFIFQKPVPSLNG